MARIRTVKPEFFRHEGLQDLEIANPGMYPMMVFEGLWGHCDKAGRFEWKPRMLKLDILPFLPFDMADTLEVLAEAGFLVRYTVNGKEYGEIGSFVDHQRIGGKELQEPARFPDPDSSQEQDVTNGEPEGNQSGSNGEATGKQLGSQEGKGREGKGSSAESPGASPLLTAYHELLPRCRAVSVLNPKRKRRIAAAERLARQVCAQEGWDYDPADFWRAYFEQCAADKWLRGDVANPKNPTWRQNLDVLIAEDRFAEIMDRAIAAMKGSA